MKIFSIVGWSGSGKTKIISRLIRYFKSKKYRVAVLKNVPHSYSLQPQGKDSRKFLDAGADLVYLSGQGEIVRFTRRQSAEDMLEAIIRETGDVDFLFLEGLTGEGIPVIEVFDPQKNEHPKFPARSLSALVSREKIDLSLPCFHPDDLQNMVRFMEENADERP